MPKNNYAARLMAAKAKLSGEERQALVHHCVEVMFMSPAIALNEEFGFGAERIARFRDKLESTVVEYGVLQQGADVEFANAKLEEAYTKICGGVE